MSADRPDDEVRGWLRSNGLDSTADYAARGRKHRSMSPDDLSAAWANSFKQLAEDFINADLMLAQNDLTAEYELRGQDPPYALVSKEMDRYATNFEAAMNLLTPSQLDRLTEDVFDEYSAFKTKRDDRHH
jgi:hypothetical protein